MNKKRIYALGFFDGVHIGHQALLAACREMAGELGCEAGVVTFTSHPDTLVAGRTPALINTPKERERLLRERFGMDTVVALPFDRDLMRMPWKNFFRLLLSKYAAAGLVCGEDFRFGFRGEGNAALLREACREAGIPCAVVPEQRLDGITVSSTYIRSLLEAGELEQANRFLGHPHTVTGWVVPGRHLGRTLGVPTANMVLPGEVLCPRQGVYACMATVNGRQHRAVTNIGTRPTVDGTYVTVESWLLDFAGDLYGQELTLTLHAFLRPEIRFDSLEALKTQIREDAEKVIKFFEKA